MTENTLFTALQISDLHFGDTAQGDSVACLDARTPSFLARFPYLDGLLGHHYLGLQDLHRFYHDLLRDRDGRVAVVVSGDVTATGSVAQFDLAAEFLGARVPAGVFGIELGLTDWARGAVSGNHDNWPGSIMVLGGPSAGLRQHFARPFPIIGRLVGIGGGLCLRFILVDSDADVGSVSFDRLMARGEFSSQLLAVEQSLPEITQGEIRVMVVHHAVADASVPVQGTAAPFPRRLPRRPHILEVGTRTLGVLERVIVEGGIKVVMTGHMHVPRLTEMIAQDRGVHATVLEARCGTTTQLDRYPTQVLAGMHRRRELPRNSLIVHEVLERDGQVVWRARIHSRSIGGFVPGPSREVVVLP